MGTIIVQILVLALTIIGIIANITVIVGVVVVTIVGTI